MARYTHLISVTELKNLQASGEPYMVFDCSFDLLNPATGPSMYAESHIAGATFAHLDTALSAKGDHAITGSASGGRHPLPSREKFAAWLGAVGFSNTMQAVVYDRQGLNYCGRLWWMLKWLGHDHVAVLNGGFQAWQASGGATESGTGPVPSPVVFATGEPLVALVSVEQVTGNLGRPTQVLVDARGAPRFRGEVEPIDPVAGHIPGALNRPFTTNLDANGFFKSAETLRAEFAALLGSRSPQSVVHHCGSGVSATPNVLAMELAGLGKTGLFAGSWSEWCADPDRPVAQG